ncbi:hypothetical protein ACFVVP_08830 [Streptomyces sp. NPDC058128]|uniref:hypothetical protein n=1 Tax=Streptomyces sp. NPDC058128 TaxID=3346352 RepID=UPI0036E6DEA5
MESEKSNECPLHGAGMSVQSLVGRRVTQVVASWHVYGGSAPTGPLDVWLVDEEGTPVLVTTGSDWCLRVEVSEPHAGYDMGESGLVTVGPLGDETPLARHIGERILAVREEHEPRTGRIALELSFPDGRVRCDGWAGDLRLTAL